MLSVERRDGVLEVHGDIIQISDSDKIKDELKKELAQNSRVELLIHNSPTITSALIGFLLKTVKIDGADITLRVRSKKLYETLEHMLLAETFNVRLE